VKICYTDSEDVPDGVIIGVTTAVASLIVIVVLVLVVGIGIACVLKKKRVRSKKDTLKFREEGSAQPISRRSSITSVNQQQPITSLTSHEQPKKSQPRVEEVNTDYHQVSNTSNVTSSDCFIRVFC